MVGRLGIEPMGVQLIAELLNYLKLPPRIRNILLQKSELVYLLVHEKTSPATPPKYAQKEPNSAPNASHSASHNKKWATA
jgi:hypothetical protein